jgi:hypothetical protein
MFRGQSEEEAAAESSSRFEKVPVSTAFVVMTTAIGRRLSQVVPEAPANVGTAAGKV